MTEEKGRVENRLSTMEEELEEEQGNNEATLHKALKQVDTLSSEVSSLQSSLGQSESIESSLEKQVLY